MHPHRQITTASILCKRIQTGAVWGGEKTGFLISDLAWKWLMLLLLFGEPQPKLHNFAKTSTTTVENHNYIHPGTRGECFDCGKKPVLLHHAHIAGRTSSNAQFGSVPPLTSWKVVAAVSFRCCLKIAAEEEFTSHVYY